MARKYDVNRYDVHENTMRRAREEIEESEDKIEDIHDRILRKDD